jgi:hypothetical protein
MPLIMVNMFVALCLCCSKLASRLGTTPWLEFRPAACTARTSRRWCAHTLRQPLAAAPATGWVVGAASTCGIEAQVRLSAPVRAETDRDLECSEKGDAEWHNYVLRASGLSGIWRKI